MKEYEITKEVIQKYRSWLAQQPHPDRKSFYASKTELSARELVDEITKKSDLGKVLHRIMTKTGKLDEIVNLEVK